MSKSNDKNGLYPVRWYKIWPADLPIFLRNLAPTNPFNPLNLWPEVVDAEPAAAATTSNKKSGKGGKASKQAKPKKADLIREKLLKDQKTKQSKQDEEKLSNMKTVSLMSMKMSTPEGRLKQLYALLQDFLKKGQTVDAIDTFWEIEGMKIADIEELAEIKKKNKKYHKKAEELLEGRDILAFQLNEMSDRLPPLNLHHMNTFVLDTWQKEVLRYIDEEKSVIVCAPTSSGKTVLSSYVSVKSSEKKRILFVVPSDALAWQVAAIFYSLLQGSVGIVAFGVEYIPDTFRVLVGTPMAVESALTTVGYDFSYAVFDEVHDLNGDEGDALERVIKSVPCPFLALSATIGNGEKLKAWWTGHHHQEVQFKEYRGRFINLQRLTWCDGKIHQLHPCAAVTREYLCNQGFASGDLAFTPRDTYSLWKAFLKFYPLEKIEDLSPQKFFANIETDRIHLRHSKEYEDVIKSRLQKLAVELPTETDALLHSFEPQLSTEKKTDLWSIVRQLCAENLTPAIFFQLDSVRCIQLLNELLTAIETEENNKYPKYRKGLEKELAEYLKSRKKMANALAKQQEEELKDAQEFGEQPPPDIYAPHPDFIIAPMGFRLSAAEFKEIKWKLRKELSAKGEDEGHALVRALRRGIGLYLKGLPWSYLMIVQQLAQKGRLAVVFSDQALAYGVNMPFRTCCFCEDTDGDILSPLMAQQMAGRSGRRGLDRQGNLLYIGFTWTRIQQLMRGILPDIIGKPSLYPTIALQQFVRPLHSNYKDATLEHTIDLTKGFYVSSDIIARMCKNSLHAFVTGTEVEENYLEKSTQWMKKLGLIKSDGSAAAVFDGTIRLIWELRSFPAESLTLFMLLDYFHTRFRLSAGGDNDDKDERNINAQLCMFNMILRIVDRRPLEANQKPFGPLSGSEVSKGDWDYVTKTLKEFEELMKDISELQLPLSVDSALDSHLWEVVTDNKLPDGKDTAEIHRLKNRVWHVGNILRILHNEILYKNNKYGELEVIFRKCFRRMKWILMDSEI